MYANLVRDPSHLLRFFRLEESLVLSYAVKKRMNATTRLMALAITADSTHGIQGFSDENQPLSSMPSMYPASNCFATRKTVNSPKRDSPLDTRA